MQCLQAARETNHAKAAQSLTSGAYALPEGELPVSRFSKSTFPARPAAEAHRATALQVICPLLSGPKSILGLVTKEEWNGT